MTVMAELPPRPALLPARPPAVNACLAAGCNRPVSGVLIAGVLIELCGTCLTLAARMCVGKKPMSNPGLARREADRLAAYNRSKANGGRYRSGRAPRPYRCRLCRSWHVGNQLIDGDGNPVESLRAADALVAMLTRSQLRQVIDADAFRDWTTPRQNTTTTTER